MGKNAASWIAHRVGTIHPIADKHIRAYVRRINEGFDDTQFKDFQNRPYSYTDKIKKAINQMMKEHTKKRFVDDVNFDKIVLKPHYKFMEEINPLHVVEGLPKILYEKESDKIYNFEWGMITALASNENILFWTRNPEKIYNFIETVMNVHTEGVSQNESRYPLCHMGNSMVLIIHRIKNDLIRVSLKLHVQPQNQIRFDSEFLLL